jgi:hypothetical protein
MQAPMMEATISNHSFMSNNPPTPQSPYMSHDEAMSPIHVMPRSVEHDFEQHIPTSHPNVTSGQIENLKLMCQTPQPSVPSNHHVTQSPSSLSTCSSATSHHDNYYTLTSPHSAIEESADMAGFTPMTTSAATDAQIAALTASPASLHAHSPIHGGHMWGAEDIYQPPMFLPVQHTRMHQPMIYSMGLPGTNWYGAEYKELEQNGMLLPSARSANSF